MMIAAWHGLGDRDHGISSWAVSFYMKNISLYRENDEEDGRLNDLELSVLCTRRRGYGRPVWGACVRDQAEGFGVHDGT